MRSALISLAAAALLAACSTSRKRELPEEALNTPHRAGAAAILVLMPDSTAALATFQGLEEELAEDFDLTPRIVSRETSIDEVRRWVIDLSPRAVVLMNNPTLRLYRRFQQNSGDGIRSIPAIAILSSFLRESSAGISNITGVIYEVPLVTSLVNLRAHEKKPVKKIGVVHRASFRRFIDEQRGLCAAEGFEIVSAEVSGTERSEIRDALKSLRAQKKVDAIWVLNDNRLLDRDLILRGWLPALKRNDTPIVVNVKSLLSKSIDFGTFAVLPDHRALGTQAGQLITALAERQWRVPEQSFEYPLSVETVTVDQLGQ